MISKGDVEIKRVGALVEGNANERMFPALFVLNAQAEVAGAIGDGLHWARPVLLLRCLSKELSVFVNEFDCTIIALRNDL